MAISSRSRRAGRRADLSGDQADATNRWMVSYADFMTLLFAFFVAMYGMAQVQQGDESAVSRELAERFQSQPKPALSLLDPPLVVAGDRPSASGIEGMPGFRRGRYPVAGNESETSEDTDSAAKLKRMADRLRENLKTTVDEGRFDIQRTGRRVEVAIQSGVLFPSGSPRPNEPFISPLQSVARVIRSRGHRVRVEGYTDDVPIERGPYRSNWELSAARAATVVRLFAELGVAPSRMSAVGYGEYRPIAPNDSPEGRARNRRVVISIGEPIADDPTQPDPKASLD